MNSWIFKYCHFCVNFHSLSLLKKVIAHFLIFSRGENPVNWEGRRIDQVLSGLFYTLANHRPTKKIDTYLLSMPFSTTCSLVNEVYYSWWKRLINHSVDLFLKLSSQLSLQLLHPIHFFWISKLMNFYWHNNQQMTFNNWNYPSLSFQAIKSYQRNEIAKEMINPRWKMWGEMI